MIDEWIDLFIKIREIEEKLLNTEVKKAEKASNLEAFSLATSCNKM